MASPITPRTSLPIIPAATPVISIEKDKTLPSATASLVEETESIARNVENPNSKGSVSLIEDQSTKGTISIVEDPNNKGIVSVVPDPAAPAPQPTAPPAQVKALDQIGFVKKAWFELSPETKKLIYLTIPFFGVGYDYSLESEKDTEGKTLAETTPFPKDRIKEIIKSKNDIKKVSIKAFAINFFVFAIFSALFPLASSMIATGYLCLMLGKATQISANNNLIEEITAQTVIPPVGQNGHVANGKTEFVWSKLVD